MQGRGSPAIEAVGVEQDGVAALLADDEQAPLPGVVGHPARDHHRGHGAQQALGSELGKQDSDSFAPFFSPLTSGSSVSTMYI